MPTTTWNVVDSSAWLEYFVAGPNAEFFAPIIESPATLIVPRLSILEVIRKILRERGEDAALQAFVLMSQGRLVDLSQAIIFRAAKLGAVHKLPLADSVILATAQENGATLWTQDVDFAGVEGVRYFPKTYQ